MAKARIALDGVAILVSEPDSAVLFVSSPKARGAAQLLLPHYVSVCCDGPPTQTDFRELKGRLVDIWAPGGADGATWAAAIAGCVFDIAQRVRIVNASDEPHGRDLPNLVAEGWDESRAVQWAADHLHVVEESKSSELKIGRKHNGVAPVAQSGGSAVASWQSLGLLCNAGGIPIPNEANVAVALGQHPRTQGKIWYDGFRQEVWHTLSDSPQAWSDRDSRRVLRWLQQDLQLAKFTKHHVHDGVLMYAEENERNSVHEFIESLPWDGVLRTEEWLCDFLGCPNDPHHRAAGRNWLISMVARAYSPGCQMDHMLILEGEQRKGKSSVLRALAQPWFATLTQRFGSKEFNEAIQSKWLIELADLTALASARHAHILAGITDRSDRYRAPWDKLASDHDRRCVFAGSTEKHNDYLADTYGIGRFWSVRCDGDINVEALATVRQQLFAEALVQFRAHEPYHLMPEQTREEQLSRVETDPYIERVQQYLMQRRETTVLEVFESVFVARDEIGRMIGRTIMDDRDAKRIAKTLRVLNWYVVQAKRDGKKRNLWLPLPEPEPTID